ncbi:hypothetical protein TNCV_5063041 [Trichonephila clavipes]|nr:hypothetical protein TNCV_5063041 [Trichonephila clavipes]
MYTQATPVRGTRSPPLPGIDSLKRLFEQTEEAIFLPRCGVSWMDRLKTNLLTEACCLENDIANGNFLGEWSEIFPAFIAKACQKMNSLSFFGINISLALTFGISGEPSSSRRMQRLCRNQRFPHFLSHVHPDTESEKCLTSKHVTAYSN